MKPILKSQAPLYGGALSRLEESFGGGEVVYSFKFNLDRENRYAYGGGAICGNLLHTVSGGGEITEVILTDITDIEYIQYVGCAAIEYKKDGELYELCRTDMRNALTLQNATKRLKAVSEGKLLRKTVVIEETSCPTCGIPYNQGSTVCPFCADRKKLLGKLWKFIIPHKEKFFLAILLFAITATINMVVPKINGYMVNSFLTDKALEKNPSVKSYLWVVALIAFIFFTCQVLRMIRNNMMVRVGTKVSVELRNVVYEKVQSMSLAGVGRRTAGEIITRVSNDTMVVKEFLVGTITDIIWYITMFLGVFIFMLITNWKLTLIIIIPVVPIFFMFYFLRKFMHRMYHRQWQSESSVNSLLHDVFSGIRVVKVFGTEKYETERFTKASRKVADISQQNELRWNLIMPFANFLVGIGDLVVLAFVGSRILDGSMQLGSMLEFMTYVGMLYGPIRWAAHLPRMLTRAMTSMTKIFELLDEEPDIVNPENAIKGEITGNIKFENTSFGYNNYENVLKKINVDINKGEMVGIVGRSGVGKTTLINLILRLYDVTEGSITIDGHDLRAYDQHALRSQIGVVLQETYLFRGTVYTNIAYAKTDTNPEEVIKSARIANAHEFIMKQPDAYNTLVGERGLTLSGGERQRIAIARTVLRDPTILILDEATASLDTETEKLIQDSLNKLISGRTTIAIAHRLSTLRNATKLVVLEKGEVEEVGTHDELMRSGGRYYKLVMAQRQMSKLKK